MLVVGENTYITLLEARDMCLDTSITALPDTELEVIIKRAFYKLESSYRVFRYPKKNPDQKANFPLSIQNDIPQDIKMAQALMLSESTQEFGKENKEVSFISVGDMATKYADNQSLHNKINNNLSRIDNIMSVYMVKSIC